MVGFGGKGSCYLGPTGKGALETILFSFFTLASFVWRFALFIPDQVVISVRSMTQDLSFI